MSEQEWIAFFDARYRKIEDCEDIEGETQARLLALSLDLAVIKTKLTFIQWFGCAVGVAVIGVAVKYLFGG